MYLPSSSSCSYYWGLSLSLSPAKFFFLYLLIGVSLSLSSKFLCPFLGFLSSSISLSLSLLPRRSIATDGTDLDMASLSFPSSPVCLSNILYPRPRPLRRHRRSQQVRPPPNVTRTTAITSSDHVSLISDHQASSFPSDLDTADPRDAAEGGFSNPTSYYHGRPGWPRLALVQEMADLDRRREMLRRSREQQQRHGSSPAVAAVVPLNLSDNTRQREIIGRLMEQYSSSMEFSICKCAKAA